MQTNLILFQKIGGYCYNVTYLVSKNIVVIILTYSAQVIAEWCWGCQSTPGIWGFRKGAKPDSCLSEFSYYYEHPRI